MNERPTPRTDAFAISGKAHARKLERKRDEAIEALEATQRDLINEIRRRQEVEKQLEAMREKLDWQNMPNRREPVRGGYEFYINEEWTCIRDAALDGDVGFQASLMKTRFDPDDERVRIRRVLDDDAILEDAKAMREAVGVTHAVLSELVNLGSLELPQRRDSALLAGKASLAKLQPFLKP